MTRFTQLHFLTCYAPSNLNRDDLGRPKSTLFGGSLRLRVSSQSLKRAWRTSDVFKTGLANNLGKRTRDLGDHVRRRILELKKEELGGRDKSIREEFETFAIKQGERFEGLFAVPRSRKEKKGGDAENEDGEAGKLGQIAFLSASELITIEALVGRIARGETVADDEIKSTVSKPEASVDVALFGRMLTDLSNNSQKAKDLPLHQREIALVRRHRFSVEASCQVAHAISVHKIAIEDDYFTAVEELNEEKSDAGAAHVGKQEFASAVLYHYICIDRKQLTNNLGEDKALVSKTLDAFTRACLTVAPSGKQNSFASRAHASFALAEKGDFQPRSLAVAFLEPVKGERMLADAIQRLSETRERFNTVYGEQCEPKSLNVAEGKGSLAELAKFVSEE